MSMITWAELQLAVMNVLWQQEPATVHDVIAALSTDRTPAYTTVLTVLTNLVKQGYVENELKPGTRMFQYRTLVSQQQIREVLAGEMIDRLFEGSPAELIRLVLTTQHLSPEELTQIASLASIRAIEGK